MVRFWLLLLNQNLIVTLQTGSIKKGNRHSEILLRDVEVRGHTFVWLSQILTLFIQAPSYVGVPIQIQRQLCLSKAENRRIMGKSPLESV